MAHTSVIVFICLQFISALAWTSVAQTKNMSADTTRLKHHVMTMSHDSMRGRRAGYEGEQKTASYIENQFQNIGLSPFIGTSYLQPFLLPRGRINASSYVIINEDTLRYLTDFSTYEVPEKRSEIESDMVFLGYGIDGPGKSYDAYGGNDVHGKIVVALQPSLIDRTRLGEPLNYDHMQLASWARTRGARGLILLENNPGSNKKRFNSASYSEVYRPFSDNFFWISIQNGYAFIQRYFNITQERIEPAMRLTAPVKINTRIDGYRLKSANVIGKLEGTDLANEYIVVTAHYDHIGVGKKINGDSICNGMLDNASGVATMLEAARMLYSSQIKPRRSVLFVATGAEEMGFIGSQYFTDHLPIPQSQIIANINLDITGYYYKSEEPYVTLLGAEYNNMGDFIEDAADESGVRVGSNTIPSFFYRSDAIVFARAGIPSIHIACGLPISEMKSGMEYFMNYYHQTTDELYKAPVSFKIMAGQTETVARSIIKIADHDKRPVMTSDLDSEKWMSWREAWGGFRMWVGGLFE